MTPGVLSEGYVGVRETYCTENDDDEDGHKFCNTQTVSVEKKK